MRVVGTDTWSDFAWGFLALGARPLMKDRGLEPPADSDATANSASTSTDRQQGSAARALAFWRS